MKKNSKFKKISFICFIAAILLLSLVCFPLVRGYNNIAAIEGFVERFGVLSVFALLFIQILQIIVALIPGTPKDLLTYFMPVTGIEIKTFLLISIFARFPSVVSSTIAGSLYAEGDIKLTLIVYAVVAVVSGIGYAIYRFIFDRRQKNGSDR